MRPLSQKAYETIPHLPGSRLGPGDHRCTPAQARIATVQARDRHDMIIVQEKLDGSNVACVKLGGKILALTRAGHLAWSSRYGQHHLFAHWVQENEARFAMVLREGERICGEWLAQAHGTCYALPHEPFVAFDLMAGAERAPTDVFLARLRPRNFVTPQELHRGAPLSIEHAKRLLASSGHGALLPCRSARPGAAS